MSAGVRAGHKDIRALVRRFRPGVVLEATGGGHFRILADGEVVRDGRGMPVTLPGSPSRHVITNTRRRLHQLGLIR